MLQIKEVNFTVSDVYGLFKDVKSIKDYNVTKYFERFLKRLKMLIGIDIKHATWICKKKRQIVHKMVV